MASSATLFTSSVILFLGDAAREAFARLVALGARDDHEARVIEVARQPKCPVLAHFGARDHYIPLDGVEAFRKAHPQVEVHIYQADHGFNCDQRGSWNEPAAKLARERTLAFFGQHVG